MGQKKIKKKRFRFWGGQQTAWRFKGIFTFNLRTAGGQGGPARQEGLFLETGAQGAGGGEPLQGCQFIFLGKGAKEGRSFFLSIYLIFHSNIFFISPPKKKNPQFSKNLFL